MDSRSYKLKQFIMHRISLILSMLLVLMLIACNGKNKLQETEGVKTIRLHFDEETELKASDFVKSRRLVLLEDADETIIGTISNIDVMDSLIILTDKNTGSVVTYDFYGQLVGKINSHGRGPGEYLNITRSWVNHDKKEVAIYDNALMKIFVFTLYGEFVRAYNSPSNIMGLALHGDFGYYYRSIDGFPDDTGNPMNYHLIMTALDSFKITLHRDFWFEDWLTTGFEPFIRHNDNVLLLTPGEQNIYELTGLEKRLKYHIELEPNPMWVNGNYNFLKTYEEHELYREQNIGKLERIAFMGGDRYLLFSISKGIDKFRSKLCWYIYDTKEDLIVEAAYNLSNDLGPFDMSRVKFFNDSLWITEFHQYEYSESMLDTIAHREGIDFSKSINPCLVINKMKLNE